MRFFGLVLAFLVCFGSAAWAQSFDKKPSMDYIQGLAGKVVVIAKQNKDKAIQDENVAKLLNENLAYERIARFVLGKHWANANEEEKKEFILSSLGPH